MTIQRTGLMALALTVILGTTTNAQRVSDKKVITSEAARKIADGCEAFAKARGWHVSVWVLDETLTPLYFYRMEGTPMFTAKPAMMKAEAAVRTGHPNEAYVQNAKTRGDGERDRAGLRPFARRAADHRRRAGCRRHRDWRLDGR